MDNCLIPVPVVHSENQALDVLKWRGESLSELGIRDGDYLFHRPAPDISEIEPFTLCIVEILAIEERRVKRLEVWSGGMVYLTPVSHIYERSCYSLCEIRVIAVVVNEF